MNLGGAVLLDLVRGDFAGTKIEGGEHFTLQGTAVALLLLGVFVLPFVASGIWAARRSGSDGSTPPHAKRAQENGTNSGEGTKGVNGFRFSEVRT